MLRVSTLIFIFSIACLATVHKDTPKETNPVAEVTFLTGMVYGHENAMAFTFYVY
jgi:hypothetical protein